MRSINKGVSWTLVFYEELVTVNMLFWTLALPTGWTELSVSVTPSLLLYNKYAF